MWPNQQKNADLVTFTKEILSGKLHFFVQWKYPTSFDKISILTWRLLVKLRNFFSSEQKPSRTKIYSISVTEIFHICHWNFKSHSKLSSYFKFITNCNTVLSSKNAEAFPSENEAICYCKRWQLICH